MQNKALICDLNNKTANILVLATSNSENWTLN